MQFLLGASKIPFFKGWDIPHFVEQCTMNSAKVPKKVTALTISERYAILALRKESVEDLARAVGESSRRVSTTLNEAKKNFRIRHKIAAHLGLTYEQCWGEDEPTEGQVRSRGPRRGLRLATPPETSA